MVVRRGRDGVHRAGRVPRATVLAASIACLAASPSARAAVNLQALSVSDSGTAGDCRALDADGTAQVLVANAGADVADAAFDVLVFADRDGDDRFDPATDTPLGVETVAPPLAPGGTLAVSVVLAGSLPFRDAPLHAWVDAGQAWPEPDEDDNFASTAAACEDPIPPSVFEPTIEWEWTGANVDTTPMVGDVNADGTPDVVFTTQDEALVVLDGRTGAEIWRHEGDPRPAKWAHLALGQLDDDPGLEVVALGWGGSWLVSYDDDGSVRWVSVDLAIRYRGPMGGVALADLDCDGVAEAIYGPEAFDTRDGSRFWTVDPGGTLGTNDDYPGFSTPVDVDGDGDLEVVAGPTAYDFDPATGRAVILWRQPAVAEGYTAVGQFDADPAPEIVVVHRGRVVLLEGDTGAVIWSVDVPQGGGGCAVIPFRCGAPTVADFDGDGEPEIGVAGADWYVVFETDGSVRWQVPIEDCSSSFTSSTVFDFEDDGAAEVVYQDEVTLHVYRGSDGAELVSVPSSSITYQEAVTIADVDADGRAEIITPLNREGGGPWQGIRVYGDRFDHWVNTRRIWNESAYHVDNVEDDGRIPPGGTGACEAPSWLTHDTYRAQQAGQAPARALADVTLAVLAAGLVDPEACNLQVEVDLRIGNAGSRAFDAPVVVTAYEGDPASGGRAAASVVAPNLGAGEWWDTTLRVPLLAPGTIDVVADDDGTGAGSVRECDESNNACSVVVERDNRPVPTAVGPVLRARGHGRATAPLVSGTFEWSGDEGLPRPDGAHYHVLRATRPDGLTRVAETDPGAPPEWEDVTGRATTLPTCHYLRVVAADRCEQEER